jgi:hypothetical protein
MKINAKIIGMALVCLLAIYGIIILIRKIMSDKNLKEWKYYMEPYGEIMDEACMNNDCTTEEGKKNATAQCMSSLEKQFGPSWAFLKSGCTNSDVDIRSNACPEPCDPESVADYILKGGKSAATDYTAQSLKALQSMNDLASQSSVSRTVLEQIAEKKKQSEKKKQDDIAKLSLYNDIRNENQDDLSSFFDTNETKEYFRRFRSL